MTTTIRIPNDVIAEVLDGEAIVLNITTGIYFRLNGVATRLWQLIEGEHDLTRIRTLMLAEYDVEPAVLEADLARITAFLSEKGLVLTDGEGDP